MKDRILVWVSPDLIHYVIAYGLQKNYDAEYFAICDVPENTKKFFLKQNLVNFEKYWFFFDHVKKIEQPPNYEYLRNFEEKYGIDLWKLAINERIFYRFFNFHKFSTSEICSILEQECIFFEKILDEVKPNFIITKDGSRHHHHLFTELCISKGIKVLMLSLTNLGPKTMISQQSHTFDTKINWEEIKSKNLSFNELQNYMQSLNFLKSANKNIEKENPHIFTIKSGIKYVFSDISKNQEQYYYYGRTKLKVLLFMLKAFLNKKIRKTFIDRNLTKQPDYNVPYVYFPIHVDMERPLLIMAPYFTNQTEIIRHIAKSLPMGYRLYVKETPAAVTREWRPISIYKEIMSIPNVTLIHPSVPSGELMKKCSLVITIAGTSGFEATFYGKPTVVFSDVGYVDLPSVTRIRSIEDLPKIIRNALKIQVNETDLNKFITFLENNVIDFDWFDIEKKIRDAFFYGGNLIDVEIDVSKMKSFLEKNDSLLNYIGKEHTHKIHKYKTNSS